MKKNYSRVQGVVENTVDTATAVSTSVETVITTTSRELEATIKPVRRGLSRRFPFVYLLLTAIGATSVFLGIEQIMLQLEILREYPWLILGGGILILLFTGTLYKKLQ